MKKKDISKKYKQLSMVEQSRVVGGVLMVCSSSFHNGHEDYDWCERNIVY